MWKFQAQFEKAHEIMIYTYKVGVSNLFVLAKVEKG